MIAFVASIVIGAAIVLQSGLNKVISQKTNLAFATFWSTLVLLGFAGVYLLQTQRTTTDFSLLDWPKKFELWMLIPGFLGFLIVAGVPWSMSKIGATRVFVILVITQLLVALIWDAVAQGQWPNTKQLIGVVMAILSVFLVR